MNATECKMQTVTKLFSVLNVIAYSLPIADFQANSNLRGMVSSFLGRYSLMEVTIILRFLTFITSRLHNCFHLECEIAA